MRPMTWLTGFVLCLAATASAAMAPIAGRLSHHVGESGGNLLVVDIWDKRADADRFCERLHARIVEKAAASGDARPPG